jgi:hypothetical protein
MERTGCNTRILHKVFESTGRPPLLWSNQQYLRPHFEVLDFDPVQQYRATDLAVASSQQDEGGRLSTEQTLAPRVSLSSSTDAANLESLQLIVHQMEYGFEQDVDLDATEGQVIEPSSSVVSDTMLVQSD